MQGTILIVDLSNQQTEVIRDEALFKEYVGGTAVGTELLFRYAHPDRDALSPEAPAIFVTGPFSALLPVATKTVALFKSPLSGELGESHAGGRLALSLREADIDALIVVGKSPSPVYLVIENHTVRIKSAKTFWGQSALATARILARAEEQHGSLKSILRIGPAGERLSPMACVTVDDSRHFGRMGLGALLGSKNLKGIVLSGTGCSPVDRPKEYRAIYDIIYNQVVRSSGMKKYHDIGTAVNVAPLSAMNGLPTRNFSQGYFEGARLISGEVFAEDYLAAHIACAHCQCGCIHMAELREEFAPYHYETRSVSYDYELIYSLGSVLSISSPKDILKLIHAVEREGWDAISIGVTLAWAAEAYVSGVIGDKETEGVSLAFGDTHGFLEALKRMARGEGAFYRDLEKGCAFCSSKYGGEDFAIHFGGVEPAGYMTGENFFTACVVGIRHSHLDDNGYSLDQQVFNKPMELEEQVRSQVQEAQWRMVINSLVVCLFARAVYDVKTILEGLASLGMEKTEEELKAFGVKALQRKHEWKKACGFDMKAIEIPKKLFRVRTTNGLIDPVSMKKRLALYREYAGL